MLSEEYETNRTVDSREEPRSLCGGTFRSRGRKRKRAPGKEKMRESYAERQQRRIRRKFGEGGVTLGDDEGARMTLEKGKMQSDKPRVAGSKRGRELRAAAALARFDQAKKEEQTKLESESSGSETELEDEDEESSDQKAFDVDGQRLLDRQGRGMFKVCEDEDENDVNVKKELDELHDLDDWKSLPPADGQTNVVSEDKPIRLKTESEQDNSESHLDSTREKRLPHDEDVHQKDYSTSDLVSMKLQRSRRVNQSGDKAVQQAVEHGNHGNQNGDRITCTVCSLENAPGSLTCMACANVLDLGRLPNHWRCESLACRGGSYVNAGDCGICGACGASKSLTNE